MVAEKKNILKVIDKYDEVDENLRKHDADFPTVDYLRSITFEGLGNNHHINIKWGFGKQPWQDIIGEGKDHISVLNQRIILLMAMVKLQFPDGVRISKPSLKHNQIGRYPKNSTSCDNSWY